MTSLLLLTSLAAAEPALPACGAGLRLGDEASCEQADVGLALNGLSWSSQGRLGGHWLGEHTNAWRTAWRARWGTRHFFDLGNHEAEAASPTLPAVASRGPQHRAWQACSDDRGTTCTVVDSVGYDGAGIEGLQARCMAGEGAACDEAQTVWSRLGWSAWLPW